MNESCNQTWTIKEGTIGTLYLTCPHCGKGRGLFLRQIKPEGLHEDIEKLAIRKVEEVEVKEEVKVSEPVVKEKKKTKKTKEEKSEKQEVKEKVEKAEKPEESEKPVKERKPRAKAQNGEPVEVPKEEQLEIEEDIFERIKKKRQQEEDFVKDNDEDVDILEISGDTLDEIENRIKEFEEYYYIKVLDKNIQQQGKRYNCIIKYCRV